MYPKLTLYICSAGCANYTAAEVANRFVNCQVYETFNRIDLETEKGFVIKLFDYNKEEFCAVWNELCRWLDLHCAFVKIPNEFSGCVLDWLVSDTHSSDKSCCHVHQTKRNCE